MQLSQSYDIVVIGAGASGLMFVAELAGRGGTEVCPFKDSLRICLLEHAARLGEKIRISGGGRCNFTNKKVTPDNFVSKNPKFAKHALNAYKPDDFLRLLKRNSVEWVLKNDVQYFTRDGSHAIVNLLLKHCDTPNIEIHNPVRVIDIQKDGDEFRIFCDKGEVRAKYLIIGTGGMAAPAVGATDFGLQIARKFGHTIVPAKPALVPLVFDPKEWEPFSQLAGVSLRAIIAIGGCVFEDDMLFTHKGLSGPLILNASSYWEDGQELSINLCPSIDLAEVLIEASKSSGSNKSKPASILEQYMPKRLAAVMAGALPPNRNLSELGHKALRQLADSIHNFRVKPMGTQGYKKAEAMSGGVDTKEVDPKSMQSKLVDGLYFIGEVLDITGHLGGYNFQWAWSSAVTCARALKSRLSE